MADWMAATEEQLDRLAAFVRRRVGLADAAALLEPAGGESAVAAACGAC